MDTSDNIYRDQIPKVMVGYSSICDQFYLFVDEGVLIGCRIYRIDNYLLTKKDSLFIEKQLGFNINNRFNTTIFLRW